MSASTGRRNPAALIIACLAAIGGLALAISAALAAVGTSKEIARGRYLVHNVGMCADCHGASLKGGPIPFKPTVSMPWVQVAPSIRGGGRFTQAQLTQILMTAKRPGNVPLLPPMPPYKLNRADAAAVARYLDSLK